LEQADGFARTGNLTCENIKTTNKNRTNRHNNNYLETLKPTVEHQNIHWRTLDLAASSVKHGRGAIMKTIITKYIQRWLA
jgi:hypothetical protein